MATLKPKSQRVNMKGLALQFDQLIDPNGRAVNVLAGASRLASVAANASVTADDHAGRTVLLSVASGATLTLPAATGTGDRYRFAVNTTITSNSYIIRVANATDVMAGQAFIAQDGGDTIVAFETAADSDTVTLNANTTGGIRGTTVELEDIAAGLWLVHVRGRATGTEATPFSATVS